jgi:hypothetical protein
MLKFLIGPVLAGTGYVVGSYYGSDAEQLVHKSQDKTYEAIDNALSNMRQSGMTSFDGGAPVPYEIKVERTPDEKLAVMVFFSGKQAGETDFTFVPQNGGHDTLIKTQIHADRTVLRPALAGTDKARLAYAPDWMLNLAFKPLLKQLAGQIERGEIARFEEVSEGEAESQWEASFNEEERNQMAEYRQYEATAPSLDPDAAAQNAGATGN